MDNEYTVFLSDLFAGLGPVDLRRMFGGQGLYHQNIIIGLIVGEALFLKTDEETRPRFQAGGGAPFVFTGKGRPVTTSYWSPPAEAFESAEGMLPWARLAQAAAVRAAARKPAKRKRPPADSVGTT
jgi:DNA transformation protein